MQSVDVWAVWTILAKWLVYVTALLAAGGAWFALGQPALSATARRSLVRVTLTAAVLGVLATLGRLALQAGHLVDDGWAGMVDPEMLGFVAESSLGASSAVRIAGLVLVAALVVPRRGGVWTAVAGALLVAVSFALTGHASVRPDGALVPLVALHLSAASFWVGALQPLYRLSGNPASRTAAAISAERFGRQAVVAVALLLFAGTALSWVLIGSVQALYVTGYGRVLLVKVLLVCSLLALAGVNKWRLVPALGGDDPVLADRAGTALRRSIGIEALVVGTVLLATAILTNGTVQPTG